MQLTFDPAFDHGAWPGPLRDREAAEGELWLGPRGLLERLELALGLGAARQPAVARASALVRQLRGRDGWWRASYEADPLGAATRLLRDRDLLSLWGWRGEPASHRLSELWHATQDAPPGLPDRLRGVLARLAGRAVDIASVEVRSPLASLAPMWRWLLDRLAGSGIRVTERAAPLAHAAGDLQAARGARFEPTADGSLTLLRPLGPLAAADEVAAVLAGMPSLDGVLVVGADAILEEALSRHGLPRPVGSAPLPASGALVRLVSEAAFAPMDPAELHALLCLDPGPVPRAVAAALVDALRSLPTRGSERWGTALDVGLERIAEERRDDVRARLDALLAPAVTADAAVPTDELVRRLQILATWARGRVASTPSVLAVAQQAALAAELIELLGTESLSLVELRRLCDELDDRAAAGGPAEAGLAAVVEPGAVAGPAETIVWWNFTRDHAPASPRLRLSLAERAALVEHGVAPPDLGGMMAGEARRWRRPLEQATRALILVAPMTSATGEGTSPHPMWDELRAVMPAAAAAGRLVRDRLELPARAVRRAVEARALPSPVTAVQTSISLRLRDTESPSSLEKLLSCPLAWSLQYPGRIRDGLSHGPAMPGPLLSGILAHDLLARVFAGGAPPPAEAEARATAILDEHLPRLCETLHLARYQVERMAVRSAVVSSAGVIAQLVADLGATVRGVELPHAAELDGIKVAGVIDLALGAPEVVLDLKWGRTSNRDRLVRGTALQLAVYAELVASVVGVRPEVGYVVLRTQDVYGEPDTTLPSATSPGTVTARETWEAARVSLATARAELEAGRLSAPAADGARIAEGPGPAGLVIAPACGYCSYAGLCGQSGGT
ncbi:MAG: PD-(D/E)XK nuclease family protein [Myxococcales bacterium]|nr:PD-(D/E)XK nuclease family protein [Myxococcales bacterium]